MIKSISHERLAQLTMELVRRESEAPPGNEEAVCTYIKDFLQQQGLTVTEQPCAPHRANVLATIPGKDSQALPYLYVGHVDVVPAGNPALWTTPPYEPAVREGRIYGRGAADMKGSVACMLHLAELYAAGQFQPQRPVQMLFDIDEEHQNLGMRTFIQSAPQAVFAIVGEPTGGRIHLGHRGVMAFQVDFYGKSCHAAQPSLGVNAIEQALAFCEKVRALNAQLQTQADPYLGAGSITVTMIEGGHKVNTIPEHCCVRIDRRLTVGESTQQATKQIEQMLTEAPGAQVKVTTQCPVGWIEKEHPQIQRLQEAARQAGKPAEISVFSACCEAGLMSEGTGIPTVILGPGEIAQAHQTDEFVSIAGLYDTARLYYAFFSMED